ncbi:beta-ketoacyl synthase N-terminal-like domain-containing protein [Streptomyces sp. SudanB182_2057]|uniref:beta-ketoacyl synthase N-terminal-like domain-containing protein n=1 Tax=Streptomyces sp. SudanB182_2057 TaxID=3035281 RepID=UPI003F5530CA
MADIDRRMAHDPLAVIGLGCMFPGSDDLRGFWRSVVAGRDCIGEVPSAWWDAEEHYDPDVFAPDKVYARRGGFLAPQRFDPLAFGMPPRSVDSVGLVQLLALRVAQEALRDAAHGRDRWHDPARTGVVLGVCGVNSTIIPLAARLWAGHVRDVALRCGLTRRDIDTLTRAFLESLPEWTEDSFPGTLGNIVSGRIANRFDLGAVNHTVDAACASSLAAVRAAADELLSRRADVMITGGADADNSLLTFMCFSKTPALSPSGRVRPFDSDSDGTLLGEGLGMLVLKRLADAERDGDRIYAVLRGLGSSSDGRAKSIYAPCGQGQLRALRAAYDDADCPPHSVGLIEAHGTGTPIGDGVEIEALDTLMSSSARSASVAVGSVKSQVGHTKAAAGAAGLIKAVLALHHKVLPPTIGVTTPAPALTRAGTPLYLSTHARPWIRDPGRPVRRAGVSAFGFGGVNYHAVLEEHLPHGSPRPSRAAHELPVAYLWHAPTPELLLANLTSGAPAAQEPAPAGHARVGFVCPTDDRYSDLFDATVRQLRAVLEQDEWEHPEGIHYRRRALPGNARVAALFAGQGSQYVGMGAAAALALPPVRRAFDDANALCADGDTLADAVFPPPTAEREQAAEKRLRRPDHAQLAVGALSLGQWDFLCELGFTPHAVLGHSFGEITALHAAGVLDRAGFLTLAHARGTALAAITDGNTDAGTMAAVHASPERLRDLLDGHRDLRIANANAPDEQVVAGPTTAVEAFLDSCRTAGVGALRLPVGAAFHTPLVAHAREPFADACAAVPFAAPTVTVYAGADGARYGKDGNAARTTLVNQLTAPVDFAARLRELHDDGVTVFVEFGPRRILAGLVRRTLAGRPVEIVSCDAADRTGDSAAALKAAALHLAVLGLPLTGINRYDASPSPDPDAASTVARTLHGPNFAFNASREAGRAALPPRADAVPGPVAPSVPLPSAHAASPSEPPRPPITPRPGTHAALAEATAAHLDAHVRFLDGQLHTAQELTRLLDTAVRGGGEAAPLIEAVQALSRHGMAVGEAHIRAGEVVTALLDPAAGDTVTSCAQPAAPATIAPEGSGASPAPAEPTAPAAPAAPVPAGREPADGGSGDRWAAVRSLRDGTGPVASSAVCGPADVDGLSPTEVELTFLEIIAERTGYDAHQLEPDLYIQEDLGIDSLKQVEIASAIWQRYPVISREQLFEFSSARTVGEMSQKFRSVLDGKGVSDITWGIMPEAGGPPPAARTYVTLRPLPAPDTCDTLFPDAPRALIVDDGSSLAATLGDALRVRGWQVHCLGLPGSTSPDGGHTLADWGEAALAAGLRAVSDPGGPPHLVLQPVGRDADAAADILVARLQHSVLLAKHVCPALNETARTGSRAAFVTVTRLDGALGHRGSGGDTTAALAGGLAGLVKTVALEAPALFCRALDLDPALTDDEAAAAFLAELTDTAADVRETGHDRCGRRTTTLCAEPDASILPHDPATPDLTEEDVLLVSGGASGITAWCVRALARAHRCGFVLLGRTDPPPAGDAPDGTPGDRNPRTKEIAKLLKELRADGITVDYVSADLLDADAVGRALAPHLPRITGLVHAAGVLGDKPLRDKTPEAVARVVGTKLTGLHHLMGVLDQTRLRHLMVFSSIAGYWGNVRQSDYALANESLVRHACAVKAARPSTRVTALVWGPWEGGMAAPMTDLFRGQGVPVLTREEGCGHLLDLTRQASHVDAVAVIGPTTAPVRRTDRLPGTVRATRSLRTTHHEPVLRDHSFGGFPLLPLTAAVGWGMNVLERSLGGQTRVHACHDFRVRRGLYFDGSQPDLATAVAVRKKDGTGAHLTITATDGSPHPCYEANYVWGPEIPAAPARIAVPTGHLDGTIHRAYEEGFFFHGPTLTGLRDVLSDTPERLVLSARMPDPPLSAGAFATPLFSPGLSDLLLQAAALLVRSHHGRACPPISVRSVELFAPLPDNAPFLVVAELENTTPVGAHCTVTACTPDGDILQRWSGVTLVNLGPDELLSRLRGAATASAPADGGAVPRFSRTPSMTAGTSRAPGLPVSAKPPTTLPSAPPPPPARAAGTGSPASAPSEVLAPAAALSAAGLAGDPASARSARTHEAPGKPHSPEGARRV